MNEKLYEKLANLLIEHPELEVVSTLDLSGLSFNDSRNPVIELKSVEIKKVLYGSNSQYAEEDLVYVGGDGYDELRDYIDCHAKGLPDDDKEREKEIKKIAKSRLWEKSIVTTYEIV